MSNTITTRRPFGLIEEVYEVKKGTLFTPNQEHLY